MLQEEAGPYAIFMRMRAFLAVTTSDEPGSFYDGFSCFKCLSVWLSFFYCLFLGLGIVELLVATLAVSAVAIFLNMIYIKFEQ